MESTGEPKEAAGPPMEWDPIDVEPVEDQLAADQNLALGIFGGLIAAMIGAVIWAVITVVTGYQIGYMAIGVGFLVGCAVRFLGKGVTATFGVVGAICSVLGCMFGNLFSVCAFMAGEESTSLIEFLLPALFNPILAFELQKAMFSPIDIVFYGLAIYAGYQFSFRQLIDLEMSGPAPEKDPDQNEG